MNTLEEKYEEGCLFIELRKYDKAYEILQSILEEDSGHYPALNKIGVIHANRGDLDMAQEYFEQALVVNENYPPSLVNLGNILKEGGDRQEAEKLYLKAIDEDPDYAIAYHNLGVMYKENNSYDMYMKYIKEYRRAIKRHSYSRAVHRKKPGNRKAGMLINITMITAIAIFILFLFTNK